MVAGPGFLSQQTRIQMSFRVWRHSSAEHLSVFPPAAESTTTLVLLAMRPTLPAAGSPSISDDSRWRTYNCCRTVNKSTICTSAPRIGLIQLLDISDLIHESFSSRRRRLDRKTSQSDTGAMRSLSRELFSGGNTKRLFRFEGVRFDCKNKLQHRLEA